MNEEFKSEIDSQNSESDENEVEDIFILPTVKNEVESEVEDTFILPSNEIQFLHQCYVCEKTFDTKVQLNDHLRLHSGEKPFTCIFCQQQFARLEALNIHKRIHSGSSQKLLKNVTKVQPANSSLWDDSATWEFQPLLKCDFCDKIFNEKRKLKVHLSTHTRPFACEICAKTFARQYALKQHVKSHTVEKPVQKSMGWTFDKDRPYVCGFCKKKFTSLILLNAHLEFRLCEANDGPSGELSVASSEEASNSETIVKEFECEYCQEVLPSKSSIKDHYQKHLNEDLSLMDKPYSETQSFNPDDVESTIEVDDSEIVAEVRYQCQYCDETFTSKWRKRDHMRTHMSHKRFSCLICDRRFFRRADCNVHYRLHTGEKRYSCDVCQKLFSKSWNLKIHKLSHNDPKPVVAVTAKTTQSRNLQFQCEFCKASFGWLSALTRHQRVHTGEKPYSCDVCHKQFTRSYQAVSHKMSHLGDPKRFQCELCQAEYARRESLKIHRKLYHPDVEFSDSEKRKGYKCDVCAKTFSLRSRWKIHIKLHDDEKPYSCTMCNKSYLYFYGLTMHMSTHTGQKPFHCDQCSMKFSTPGALKRHSLTHTGYSPFECDNCGKGFTQSTSLKIHEKKCLQS